MNSLYFFRRDGLADVAKASNAFGFAPSSDIETWLREYMSRIKTDPITIKRLEL